MPLIFIFVLLVITSCTDDPTSPSMPTTIDINPVVGSVAIFAVSDLWSDTLYYDTVTIESVRRSGDTLFYEESHRGWMELLESHIITGSKRGHPDVLSSDSSGITWAVDVAAPEHTVLGSIDMDLRSDNGDVIGRMRISDVCGRREVPINIGSYEFKTREMFQIWYTLDANNQVVNDRADTMYTQYYSSTMGYIRTESRYFISQRLP